MRETQRLIAALQEEMARLAKEKEMNSGNIRQVAQLPHGIYPVSCGIPGI